ncbi:MAG: lysophospholipid acyltransferase family protein [Burkholderiales bacterium]|nr:lysophospholipid acyltransferase family protein [Burkholderiales bacterium]
MSFALWLLRGVARCPLRLLHGLGTGLGWAAYAVSPSYRQRLNANAALAGVSEEGRRAAIGAAGRMSMETPRLWLRAHDAPIADPVRWEDAELVEEHIGRGRGLVLLTPHIGSFEVTAQAYAERFGARQPLTVLYRPARQALLRELQQTARARPHLATAPATLAGVRQLMRALKRGETVGMLPDQVPPEGMGVWAPFFGRQAYTMTLAAKLARQSGAEMLVIWGERLPRGAGYVIRPMRLPTPLASAGALPAEAEAVALADATAINRSMEALIRAAPSQYLWGYHRYKQPRQQPAPAAEPSATPS